jgi:hypothetical protein
MPFPTRKSYLATVWQQENMSRTNKPDAATTQRAPTARSRVSNGRDILPGVDGRSPLARRYRDVLAALVVDQGGDISEARIALCRRFAASACMAEAMEADLVNGKQIDIGEHCLLSSTLVRLANRIGIHRIPRDVTPTLEEYLQTINAEGSG